MTILPLKLASAEVKKRGQRIIGPIDLTLEAGGATVILGPNGAGKTTLLRAMHGIDWLSPGMSRWAVDRDEADLRQAYVFQTPILLRRSVLDNVAYPLIVRGEPKQSARMAAGAELTGVGLEALVDHPAHVLSGGEKQKLALARALVTRPEILFLDEPTASLDGRSKREIESLLLLARDVGRKIVMATHDLGQARRLASEVLFLLNGNIHEAGPAEAFFEDPRSPEARAFLKGDIVE